MRQNTCEYVFGCVIADFPSLGTWLKTPWRSLTHLAVSGVFPAHARANGRRGVCVCA